MTIPLRNGPGGKRDRKKYPGHVTFGTMPPRSGLFYASPQLGLKSQIFIPWGCFAALQMGRRPKQTSSPMFLGTWEEAGKVAETEIRK